MAFFFGALPVGPLPSELSARTAAQGGCVDCLEGATAKIEYETYR